MSIQGVLADIIETHNGYHKDVLTDVIETNNGCHNI